MENYDSIYEEKEGNLLTGIVGALLGGLLGTAVWMLIGLAGYIASIVAMLTTFLSLKGYDLLHGRPGKVRLITVVLVVVLSVIVGTVGTLGVMIAQEYYDLSDFNSFDQKIFYMQYPDVFSFAKVIFADADVQKELVSNIGMGMLFAALGAYSIIRSDVTKRRAATAPDTFAPIEEENSLETDAPAMLEAAEDENTTTNLDA